MNDIKEYKISKLDFLKLNEEDLMFITNPGRMGDEDGSTFIIKNNNEFIIYRVDGWLYGKDEIISMDDMSKQFPKWRETWKHANDENYDGKYKFIYMGFGNGLCVDKSIYNEYEPYLNELVDKYIKENNNDERFRTVGIFNVWKSALINMSNDKGYIIKRYFKI